MIWRIRCFAVLRDRTGLDELEVELPPGATVGNLKAWVEARHPALAGRLQAVRVAADYEFLGDSDPLPPGAELALIPPVSGGAPDGAPPDEALPGIDAELRGDPLSVDRAVAFVSGPDAGAVVTFLGTVRGTSRGSNVLYLEYEAYPEMALRWMRRLARAARDSSGALRVALHHRTGRVAVGETSVVIAVAAAHRAAAFEAARAVIEALKADVPIWKREVQVDGAVWVGWGS